MQPPRVASPSRAEITSAVHRERRRQLTELLTIGCYDALSQLKNESNYSFQDVRRRDMSSRFLITVNNIRLRRVICDSVVICIEGGKTDIICIRYCRVLCSPICELRRGARMCMVVIPRNTMKSTTCRYISDGCVNLIAYILRARRWGTRLHKYAWFSVCALTLPA